MEVTVLSNDLNKAVKVLRRKLQHDGLYKELRNRRFYEKNSEKRRRKASEALRRLRKKQKKLQRR